MKILFTGGSSFTGSWFLRELAAAGHEVTATFRQTAEGYAGDAIRGARVAWASEVVKPLHGVAFGDDVFLETVASQPWDVLCHHAADVTNYRSPDFDVVAALANNTKNLNRVLAAFHAGGGRRVVLTGTVFEGGEGAGSDGLPDFSPYGLSKGLTAQVFRFACDRQRLRLGKFVIPNPFGPHEEPRYTAYLIKNWLEGKTPSCGFPRYIRDNIPISLLAKVYARFVANLPVEPGFSRINPSGYVESQGAFTERLAREMRPRLGKPCEVTLNDQRDFPEPRIRINTEIPDLDGLDWNESAAWDAMAAYYQKLGR